MFQNIKKQYPLKHNDNDNINNIVHSTVKIVFRSHFHVFIRTEFISYISIHNNNNNKNVIFYVRGGLPAKKKEKKITLVIRSLVYFLLFLSAVAEPTWKSEGTLLFIHIDY